MQLVGGREVGAGDDVIPCAPDRVVDVQPADGGVVAVAQLDRPPQAAGDVVQLAVEVRVAVVAQVGQLVERLVQPDRPGDLLDLGAGGGLVAAVLAS
ncbi:hypothetical protein [Micromonospora chersina]|uniref:hypothetical protein n=1 Tax=Micromonospora chersina TaxID=47854 RepID=UPI0033B7D752